MLILALSKVTIKLGSVDLSIYLSDIYDDVYNIYNRTASDSGLSPISIYNKEKTVNGSVLENSIDKYLASGLKQVYDLSINEYFNLPVDYIDLLIEKSEIELKKRKDVMDELENKMEI